MPALLAIQIPWSGQHDLAPALAALTGINVAYMMRVRLPALYASGVRYKRENRKADGSYYERWLAAPELIRLRVGDCEDLCCYRASELRVSGEDPRAMAIARRSSLGWHIVVRRGDGSIEDPSRKLGMGSDE